MVRLTRLFEPGRIGKLELKNRFIMAPMTTFSCQDGLVTDATVNFYAERARGGVGLIIIPASIDSRAPGGKRFAALWDDKFIPRLRDLANKVHRCGAKIAVQLNHHGAMHSEPELMAGYRPHEIDIIGASAIPHLPTGVVPRELSKDEIGRLVYAWAEAARRAAEAGFDAVEIQGAHGRLLNQFASPFYNKRTDEYGGSPERRIRFACEVVLHMRERLAKDFPIIYRISGDDGFIGGTTKDEAQRQAQLLEKAGIDAIHVTSGAHAHSVITPTYLVPPGPNIHLAEGIRRLVRLPVIAVGSLGDPILAERVLVEEKADFIALGRPLLADPYLPVKVSESRIEDIHYCLRCNNCVSGMTFTDGKPLRERLSCTVNPALFRENEFVIRSAGQSKNVMVVGGGLAGMEAACILNERGHTVTLYEAGSTLGGQWNIACRGKSKGVFASLLKTLSRQLVMAGIKIELETTVDRELVRKTSPDAVVIATGAVPATLNIPGINGRNVVQANDVILGKAKVGDRVVIVGGRYRGMDAAIFLAGQDRQVHLVTRRSLGRDTEPSLFRNLRDRLIYLGVCVYPCSEVFEITDRGVSVLREKELISFHADTVVLAVGSKPENSLAEEIKEIVPELYTVGDCVAPRSALEAINEAADAAVRI